MKAVKAYPVEAQVSVNRARRSRRIWSTVGTYLFWTASSLVTLLPIYWLVLVSTRSRVDLFGAPNLSPTFFSGIFTDNFANPFVRGSQGDYLINSIIVATSNAVLVIVGGAGDLRAFALETAGLEQPLFLDDYEPHGPARRLFAAAFFAFYLRVQAARLDTVRHAHRAYPALLRV